MAAGAGAEVHVGQPLCVAEIGDFSSTACLAATAIYDRAGMVQLSPTSLPSELRAAGQPVELRHRVGTQAGEGPVMARIRTSRTLGKKRLAVLYINNDMGNRRQGSLHQGGQGDGRRQPSPVESYFETDKDFTGGAHEAAGQKPELLYNPVLLQRGRADQQAAREARLDRRDR
jgi:branched-chain amino acid transport system substrate-binding protein